MVICLRIVLVAKFSSFKSCSFETFLIFFQILVGFKVFALPKLVHFRITLPFSLSLASNQQQISNFKNESSSVSLLSGAQHLPGELSIGLRHSATASSADQLGQLSSAGAERRRKERKSRNHKAVSRECAGTNEHFAGDRRDSSGRGREVRPAERGLVQ